MAHFKFADYFSENIMDHQQTIGSIAVLQTMIEKAVSEMTCSLNAGQKLIFCGNGGSAADSQHLAAEFTGRFTAERKPLAALALTTDSSALTCIGNDYSFDDVFSRQLAALGKSGDTLVAISTSGNSANVVKAVQVAKEMGIYTIGMLGKDGGKLSSLCHLNILVPSTNTARIQEAHILIGHILCGAVERSLGLVNNKNL
jgi:D-sedoheptulose 7-phosphate isomerase